VNIRLPLDFPELLHPEAQRVWYASPPARSDGVAGANMMMRQLHA
jgi:hypothetical protein